MALGLPSFGGFASTKQFSGRSGDVSGLSGSKFSAFNEGLTTAELLIFGAAAFLGWLIFIRKK